MIPSLPLRVLTRRAPAFLLTTNQLRVIINRHSNNSDASGGSVFRIMISPAMLE